jgi:hypothetical protein
MSNSFCKVIFFIGCSHRLRYQPVDDQLILISSEPFDWIQTYSNIYRNVRIWIPAILKRWSSGSGILIGDLKVDNHPGGDRFRNPTTVAGTQYGIHISKMRSGDTSKKRIELKNGDFEQNKSNLQIPLPASYPILVVLLQGLLFCVLFQRPRKKTKRPPSSLSGYPVRGDVFGLALLKASAAAGLKSTSDYEI